MRSIPNHARLACVLALACALAACTDGSGSRSVPIATPAVVTGVKTPSSIAVVTPNKTIA